MSLGRHCVAWTAPDGIIQNQTDHVLIDKKQHSSITDIQSFRGDDCDTDHHLVTANIRERLSVQKQAKQKFDMERFKLNKLNNADNKVQYQGKISNMFAALEYLK
jgi:hypothetical protein